MYQLAFPAEALLPYIENYWSVYPAPGEKVDLTVNVFVDARADLIFNFGAPYLRQVIGQPSVALTSSNLDAQRLEPIRIRQQGDVAIVGIRFYAGGLAPFCPQPLQELTDRTPLTSDVFGPKILKLERDLQQAGPDPQTQKQLLDSWLQARMSLPTGYERFRAFKERIENRAGAESVEQICQELELSLRSADRLFARCLGLSPKVFARITRFQKALRLLMTDPGCSLAEVAGSCGYYDQSHFIKDFKRFSGGVPRGYKGYYPETGPSDFAPNVVRFLQDGGPD